MLCSDALRELGAMNLCITYIRLHLHVLYMYVKNDPAVFRCERSL